MTCVEAAMHWVEERLALFEPLSSGKARVPAPMPESPILELAVTCRWLHHQSLSPAVRDMVEAALDHVAEVFYRPPFSERLFRRPQRLRCYAWLVAILADCGRLRGRTELDLLQRLVDAGHPDLTDPTQPTQWLLELRYILDLGGIRHNLPSNSALLADSMLARPVDYLTTGEIGAYAVTHVIMYLTDMGNQPLTWVSTQCIAEIGAVVDRYLAVYLRARNLDLIAELLLCRRALGLSRNALSAVAWQYLSAEQDPAGMVPGPHFDPDRARALDADRSRLYTFGMCYHATLVSSMAAVLEIEDFPGSDTVPPVGGGIAVECGQPSWLIDGLSRARAWLLGAMNAMAAVDLTPDVIDQFRLGLTICDALAPGPLPEGAARLTCPAGSPAQLIGPAVVPGVSGVPDALPPWVVEPYSLLLADNPALIEACRYLNTVTTSGIAKLPLAVGERASDLAAVLTAAAIHALRGYQLAEAAQFIRTLAYVRAADPALSLFLLAQQRPDGGFGYFGMSQPTEDDRLVQLLRLDLPATVASVWALAETLNPTFRLAAVLKADKADNWSGLPSSAPDHPSSALS